jgi:hypothetical protein
MAKVEDKSLPAIVQFSAKANLITRATATKTALLDGRLGAKVFSQRGVNGTTNIIPLMNPNTLYQGCQYVLQYIYSPERYYQRIRAFLCEYQSPKIKAHLQLQYILAFFSSIYHLGVVGKERVHYWRLLLWALFLRPRLFPMAVTLAIWGYRFRKISELLTS